MKNSPKNNLKIHTYIFYTNHLEEPAGFKSSERLSIDSAWKKWKQLQQQGWTELYHDYGQGFLSRKSS